MKIILRFTRFSLRRKSRPPAGNRKGRRGSAMVEAALTFTAFSMILTGMLDLSQILFFHQVLAERVRTGARYAAVNNYDTQKITNMVLYNKPTAPAGIDKSGLFGLKASDIVVQRFDAGEAADRIEVKIANHALGFFSPFFAKSSINRTFKAVIPAESLGATD
jgi:Flp pilus assembly protein TadG